MYVMRNIFNIISQLLATFMIFNSLQAMNGIEEIPIEKDASGKAEIHHTRIFRTFQRWQQDGCFEKIFVGSVQQLFENKLLDTDIIHGDGSTTVAKKGAII